jgi:Glycosyltransferase family 87
MLASLARARVALIALFQRLPWIGWLAWSIFVGVAIARIHPRRFDSTFAAYLDAAERLWGGERVYNPLTLGDFLYFPISLLIHVPLTKLDPVSAAAIVLTIDVGFFAWACAALMGALLADQSRSRDALALAGVLLFINIPAAWFNVKGIQAQMPMTAAMIAACASMLRGRWNAASFWLFIAIVVKPLAIVMVLLCAALVREMRLPLVGAVVAMLLLPFAFLDWSYLLEQYRLMGLKLWLIATELPSEWLYQADLSTLLRALGIDLPAFAMLGVRLAAALGTLALAWRVRRAGGLRSFAFAVLLLSGCYITLFGPRNEYLSFIVLTPSITALALVMIGQADADYRGWLLILAAVGLGFVWRMDVNSALKPAIVVAIYAWLAWLMAVPARWREIMDGNEAEPSSASEQAMAGAAPSGVAGHR